MKLTDIFSQYPYEKICGNESDPVLLHETVKPIIESLHQDTIVYIEKGYAVVKLSDIDLNERRFGARATKIAMLWQKTRSYPQSWKFGCNWDAYRISEGCLVASPYVGYRLMFDPDIVGKVLWCVKKRDHVQAVRLVSARESEGSKIQELARNNNLYGESGQTMDDSEFIIRQ